MRKLRRLAGGRLLPCILSALFLALLLGLVTVFLPRLLAPVAILGTALSAAAALAAVLSDRPSESKLSRLLLILFLPWTGALLSLLLRDPPPPAPIAGGNAWDRVNALCGGQETYAESVRYFPVGKEMGESLLEDLKTAKRCVFLEYYIVENGVFFSDILRVLSARAKEGVDVRLLYDDFGCSLTLPRDFAQTLSTFGICARPYGKLKPTRAATRRDHRKLAVIDGEVAYTGGINLADEYVGKRIRFGHWKDTAVRLTGEPAARFSSLFLAHWQKAAPKGERKEENETAEIFQNRTNAAEIPCAVLSDDAENSARCGVQAISLFARSARHTLYLTTPYLAPDAALLTTLKGAASCGVDVRLMIPHIPDKKAVFVLTRAYARELARAGVGVREYAAGFLHAKNLVADGEFSLVSTYNLDRRSLWLQAECGAAVRDRATAEALTRDFLSDWTAGLPVPPARPFERLFARLLRLFSPLL